MLRRGGPSDLVTLDEDSVWELDAMPAAETLRLLGAKLGVERIKPFVNCGGIFCGESRPAAPSSSAQKGTATCGDALPCLVASMSGYILLSSHNEYSLNCLQCSDPPLTL